MKIYIGNLHRNVSEAQIEELFKEFGEVSSVQIVMDRGNGRSREFGYVRMANRADGISAIAQLSSRNFMNRCLDVKEIP